MRGTKKVITLLLVVIMIIGLVVPAMATSHNFTDVRDGQWYSEAVQFVYANGIMGGIGNNRFNPQGNLTRAEISALIFRLHHGRRANASDSTQNNFTDVRDTWYTAYVTWMNTSNIDNGTGNQFFPNRHATRQEFATMMYAYAMNMTDFTDTGEQSGQWTQFTDRNQIASASYAALRWMNFHGVITGSTATRINPTGTLTRAEAATIFMRFMNIGGNNNNQNPQPQTWTVTFDLNGGSGNFPNQQVRHGELVNLPTTQPTRNNHRFLGWQWDFQQQPVFQNVTIFAMWENTQMLTPAQAEAEFVRLINQHRALYGLRPMISHAGLADVARAHSTMQREHGFLGHGCVVTGTTIRDRVVNNPRLDAEFSQYFDPNNTRPGMSYSVGEVITTAGVPVNSAEGAVRSLLNSPSHRNGLMSPNNYYIGVGLDGVFTIKMIRPIGNELPAFVPGGPPPNTHPFNPQ